MKITIIGAAGTLGSCAAFDIVRHSLADEIVMIDANQDMLISHAVDLNTAVAGQDLLVRTGNDADMSGSDVIIVTASAPRGDYSSRMDALPRNLPIIREIAEKIKRFCPEAVVITVTNPVDPLNYAMYLRSSLDRRKVIGYSLNDSIRFRILLAKALGTKTSQTDGTVIGEHGNSQVLLFSSVRVKGKSVSISDELKQNIRQQAPNMLKNSGALKAGRNTGWTSAVGITAMVRAIGKDSKEVIPCSVVLEGEYGCQGLSMGVPAVLGKGGIQDIMEWKLPSDEQAELEHSISVLKPAMKQVEEYLSTGSH